MPQQSTDQPDKRPAQRWPYEVEDSSYLPAASHERVSHPMPYPYRAAADTRYPSDWTRSAEHYGYQYPIDRYYHDSDYVQHHWPMYHHADLMQPAATPRPLASPENLRGSDSGPPPSTMTTIKRPWESSLDYAQGAPGAEAFMDMQHSGGQHQQPSKNTEIRKGKKLRQRFTWPDVLHRDFVGAVFTAGLMQATPGHLSETMSVESPQVHIQTIKKYLKDYQAKHEAMKTSLFSSLDMGIASVDIQTIGEHEGGYGPSSDNHETSHACHILPPLTPSREETIMLSVLSLSEEEAHSHLGASLGYLVGLLKSLEQQVIRQRAEAHLASVQWQMRERVQEQANVDAALFQLHEAREQARMKSHTDRESGTGSTAPSTTTTHSEDDQHSPAKLFLDPHSAGMLVSGRERQDSVLSEDISCIDDDVDGSTDETLFGFLKAL